VRSPKLTIVRVDEDAERDVWVWLRRHDERTTPSSMLRASR
jgi:hypothetical protein